MSTDLFQFQYVNESNTYEVISICNLLERCLPPHTKLQFQISLSWSELSDMRLDIRRLDKNIHCIVSDKTCSRGDKPVETLI